MHVTAKDLGTGKTQDITITASSNLSDADIDKAIKEAEMYAEEDKKRKEVVDNKNALDQLVASIEKFLRESGDKISEEDKTRLTAATDKAKETLKTANDAETLKSETEELSKVSNEIFTKLYQNANPNGGATDGTNGGNADNNGGSDPNNFGDFTTK